LIKLYRISNLIWLIAALTALLSCTVWIAG